MGRARARASTRVAGVLAVAALSCLVVAPAPGYDPWAWLLWGREIAHGTLSTLEGPAFKPLPVAATTLLAPLGSAAPWIWVLLARAAAIAALAMGGVLVARLTGSRGAGAAAALAVLLTGGYAELAAAGSSEGLLLALAVGAAEAARRGRPRLALALAAGAGLVRVEAWPFLVAAGSVAWRRRPADRALVVAAAVLVPAAWLVPEYLGSGDLLRSGARARIPNPGQPALAEVPFLASLREALALAPWPVGIGLAIAAAGRRRALLWPAAAGAAWVALVAAMAQVGFSGEARYALPGMALLAAAGAGGLVAAAEALSAGAAGRTRGIRGALVAAVGVALVVPAGARLSGLPAAQRHGWRLARDLPAAVEAAGGRAALLRCGTPYTGRYRGPLTAYVLGVPKRAVEPDDPPRAPGVVLTSRLTPRAAAAPRPGPGFVAVAHNASWRVSTSCVPLASGSPAPWGEREARRSS